MTEIAKERFQCPSCGCEGEADVYKAIDVTMNPELRERVIEGGILFADCPKCGEQLKLPEEVLYSDTERRFLINMYPPEQVGQWEQFVARDREALKRGSDEGLDVSRVRCRTCFGINELKEKIAIFEAGLDDKTMEIVKLIIYTQNEAQFPNGAPVMLFAGLGDDGAWVFWVYDDVEHHEFGHMAVSPGIEKTDFSEFLAREEFQRLVEEPFVNYRKAFVRSGEEAC